MASASFEGTAVAGARSLEVRWIFSGQLESAVAGWFARFPAEMEAREDAYLLSPGLYGVSVKIRASRALEVKVYQGGSRFTGAAGRAHGYMQHWQKWSFPISMLREHADKRPGWRPVGKRRRVSRFMLAGGQAVTCTGRPGGPRGTAGMAPPPGHAECAVELTEINTGGEDWWSLGFEAVGSAGLLPGALEATAALMFAEPPPRGVELRTDRSLSYAEWLCDWTPRPAGDDSGIETFGDPPAAGGVARPGGGAGQAGHAPFRAPSQQDRHRPGGHQV